MKTEKELIQAIEYLKAKEIAEVKEQFPQSCIIVEQCSNGIDEWEETSTLFHNGIDNLPEVIELHWRDDDDEDSLNVRIENLITNRVAVRIW